MKILLVGLVSVPLMGCMQAYITCESGGNCNLSQVKNVPVVVGKDIQDTGKTVRTPNNMQIETKDYEGRPAFLNINLP